MGKISILGYEPGHVSYSSLNGYRMCGKQYELSRVLRLEERPGLASIGGNAVHVCTEAYDKALFFGSALDNGDEGSSHS